MNRTILAILIAAALAPMASAGGYDASVRYLDGESGCEESSAYDGDGWWEWTPEGGWGWSWSSSEESESCRDDFTYAGATVEDEDGEVVSVRAGADQWSSSEESRSGSSWGGWTNESSWGGWQAQSTEEASRGDARSVAVTSREGSLTLTNGCSETSNSARSSDGSYSYNYENWSSSSGRDAGTENRSERCGTDVAAQRGDEAVGAGYGRGCSSGWTHESRSGSWSYGDDWSGSSSSEGSGASECRDGADVNGADESAFVGQRSTCDDTSRSEDWYGDGPGENDSYGESWWESTWTCSGGYVIEGPDGMEIFLGNTQWNAQQCHGTSWEEWTCEEQEGEASYLLFSWSHSPLGPQDVVVPLP